ncbi:arylesterase [Desulfonatronovibrio magnus]|uniref:arylesterase n=1 Tax=Desulfonatronovibrio magnus TaxID=698827 RepID=UPI0005EBBF30|nr:arylesterase [Desulfonatronovibrio magnus]
MITILALGDSLTAGYGLTPEDSFASRLEKRLQKDGWKIKVINGGVSGDTTHDGLMRLQSLLRHKPDLVIVQFGANDLFVGLMPGEVKTNLEKIIDACNDHGAKVVLAGIECLVDHSDAYSTEVHQAFKQVALSRQVQFIEDFMPGIPGNADLTLPDGLHPNRAGVDKMVENISPLLDSELNLMRAVPSTQLSVI